MRAKLFAALAASFMLSACYIGPGGICGPQTPRLNCLSKEEQDKVLYPLPAGAKWIKEGMTDQSRMADWVKCGGYQDGSFSPYQTDVRRLEESGLSHDDARMKLLFQLENCMKSSGYKFTGNCTELIKNNPACLP